MWDNFAIVEALKSNNYTLEETFAEKGENITAQDKQCFVEAVKCNIITLVNYHLLLAANCIDKAVVEVINTGNESMVTHLTSKGLQQAQLCWKRL